MDISQHRPIFGLFPVFTAPMLFNDIASNYLRNIFIFILSGLKLNSKNARKFFHHCRGCLGTYLVLRKRTKNAAEHVMMKKILIYARECVNKDFVHSGLIGHIYGKHARYAGGPHFLKMGSLKLQKGAQSTLIGQFV